MEMEMEMEMDSMGINLTGPWVGDAWIWDGGGGEEREGGREWRAGGGRGEVQYGEWRLERRRRRAKEPVRWRKSENREN
jgi:hypothetical protein